MTLQNVKIQLRADDLSNWISADPILRDNEFVIVNDAENGIARFKIGNGISSFTQLPYVNQHKIITNTVVQGPNNDASQYSFASGIFLSAAANFSQAFGINAHVKQGDDYSFVWNGDSTRTLGDFYETHGQGTFNINPVGGLSGVYIGEQTLASMLNGVQSIEWADLTSLVQTSALNPGMKYRITDFVTTVDQEDCRSAGHQFDIIVTAIDHHTLDENARATIHDGDDYFAARPFHVSDYQQYLEYARVPLESWEIKYCLDNDKARFKFADTENGKGVIYYMKDEFGNEAPYDFKNVQFKRYRITSSPEQTSLEDMYGLPINGIEVDEEDMMWCYTFNGADYEELGFSEPYDFSGWHVRPTQAVIQQFGNPSIGRLQECAGNVIQARQEDGGDFSLMSFKLPNNVFHCVLDQMPVSELPFIKIGYFNGNRLGLNCYSNTFGNNCHSNTFGNYCNYNTFGNNCNCNKFGDFCYHNIFGNVCASNTFGGECTSNIFDSNCCFNTFGNDCDYNTFGNNCYSNIFGNDCDYNTFSNDCDYNTFGNDCTNIEFSSSYCKYITVDSGNQYILLNCTQSTYNGNEYKNVRILPGVNNTTSYKTINDNNVNQSFCTTYQPANSQMIAV